ncbi:hypothetical protein G9A89_021989 [Geosiphon pyriformis]|nr:hypothetical protein G9A89_021989 [Geosiphon pyriformis]
MSSMEAQVNSQEESSSSSGGIPTETNRVQVAKLAPRADSDAGEEAAISTIGEASEGAAMEDVKNFPTVKPENNEPIKRRATSELGKSSLTANPSGTGKAKIVVDREKTCPFLLRIFCQEGSHHGLDKYTIDEQPTNHEVQIYTWKDATLKEIANLIKQIKPDAQRLNARISFKLVYQDQLRNCYMFKDLGMVMNSRNTVEEDNNLDDARFVIGDFLDVAVFYGMPASRGLIERRSSNTIRDQPRDRAIGRDRDSPRVFRSTLGRDTRERGGRDRDRERDRDRNGVRNVERDRDRGGRDGRSFRERRR